MEEHPHVENSLGLLSESKERCLLLGRIRIVEVGPIEIHNPVVVVVRLELTVDISAIELVKVWMLLKAQFSIGVVSDHLVQEWGENNHCHMISSYSVPVRLKEFVSPMISLSFGNHLGQPLI